MRWTDTQAAGLLADVESRVDAAAWPEPPAGFERVGPLRPMRQVLRGCAGPAGTDVFVKWNRQVTAWDRLAATWRGGRAPREGRVLRALADRGLPVPQVLAYTDEGHDLLVTRAIPGLEAVPAGAGTPRRTQEAVTRLLARAWAAGLHHRDLHRGNVALADGAPVLVDVGGAVLGGRAGLVSTLGRAAGGFAGGLTRSQRLRALRTWCEEVEGGVSRERLHDLARRADRAARRRLRAYRRGRDRRARRSGRQFELVAPNPAVRGVRRRGVTEGFTDEAVTWVESPPTGVRDLKGDGRVLRLRPTGAARDVVVKRYGPVAPGRLPRPIRAFRLGVVLQHRDVDVPRPLLALAGKDGAGVLVSDALDAPDLHGFTAGGRGGALALLPPAERRALVEGLGRFLRHLHDEELTHRDLKAPNLLVGGAATGRPRFWVTDLEGARRMRGPVGWKRRARDLARLDASLDATRTDRARVLGAYTRVLPRPPVGRRTLASWIAAHVARKRGPSGRPR